MTDSAFTRLFDELSNLGNFNVWRDKDGKWSASVEFPAPEGVTAQCRSGFDHPTAISALQVLHDRLGGLRSMVNIPAPAPGISHTPVAL